MNLTTAIFWTLVTSVSMLALCGVDLQTGILLRLAPAEVWGWMGLIIFVSAAINMGVAIVRFWTQPQTQQQASRLPDLRGGIMRMLFPAPPVAKRQYASATRRRVRQEVE